MSKSYKSVMYIDMDDTICNYREAYLLNKVFYEYPQSNEGFFINLQPIENAIESVNLLREIFDVYILTRPSYMNPLCYTEKRLWVEKFFGLDFCKKFIISPNKALLKGGYLIDDVLWDEFEGKQIQFGNVQYPDWDTVLKEFNLKL